MSKYKSENIYDNDGNIVKDIGYISFKVEAHSSTGAPPKMYLTPKANQWRNQETKMQEEKKKLLK